MTHLNFSQIVEAIDETRIFDARRNDEGLDGFSIAVFPEQAVPATGVDILTAWGETKRLAREAIQLAICAVADETKQRGKVITDPVYAIQFGNALAAQHPELYER